MLQNPKVSVLMPVYNCELYIQEAVDSILNQTFKDFEFIIIDDCSTDNTVSIINSFKDSRINLIIKPQNTGYTNSLNYGLSIAKGKYIARMDGDDISLPERFAKQIYFLDNNLDYVLCGTALKVINQEKIIQYPENHIDIKTEFLNQNCIVHPSVMLRKRALDLHNFSYNILKEPAEDYDLWARLSKVSKLYNLPEVLIHYRIHEQQISKTKSNIQIKSSNETKFMVWNFLEIDDNFKDFLQKIIANENLNFEEIYNFKAFKNEIISLNSKQIFETNSLKNHLNKLEKKIISKYFFNRLTYNPKLIIEYLKIKYQTNFKTKLIKEISFCVKSILFWKVKNSKIIND